MRHIAIIYKRMRPEAAELAHELEHWFEERGVEVFCRENIASTGGQHCGQDQMRIPDTVEAVIVLGGDGTLLSVARHLAERTTPVVGVNLGGLGFLTEIARESYIPELDSILTGNYEIRERMRLHVQLYRGEKVVLEYTVLNDAVINKAAIARIIDLKATINGRYLTNYRADGLIVATPTGSTAYNLSAGGPIVYPTAKVMILTPICSFALTNRPIILPSDATIEVELGEFTQNVTLTCDGQVGCELLSKDRIVISAAARPLRLIRTPSISYLNILRTKLKWGQN